MVNNDKLYYQEAVPALLFTLVNVLMLVSDSKLQIMFIKVPLRMVNCV